MSRGDVHWFAAWDLAAKTGNAFNLNADTLKLGVVTNAVTPGVGTADPRWGSGGTTNLSTAQVGVATGYAGPITLTGVSYSRSVGVNKLDFDDVTIPLDASGFTNAYYGIVYDDTVPGKYAIGYIDLGGPVSIQAGPLNINVNAGGLLTATAS
jgi:hypothetical protein